MQREDSSSVAPKLRNDEEARSGAAAALGRARSRPAIGTALYSRDASVIAKGSDGRFSPNHIRGQACIPLPARAAAGPSRRGSGTGRAGGAVPCGGAWSSRTRMDTIQRSTSIGVALVGPGVLNLDVTRHLAPYGVHFAPDPSSQQSCSIGGNVANNSGGPHCLAYGVTSAHVVALEVVLPDGEIAVLGGLDPEPAGLDLRGAFGAVKARWALTKIAVRLTPNPPTIRTMLIDFESVAEAGATVSGIIAAGVVPAAIEMMDALTTRAVEDFVHAGYPTDAAAILLVEVDGLPGGVEHDTQTVTAVAQANRARTIASPPMPPNAALLGRDASPRSAALPASSRTITAQTRCPSTHSSKFNRFTRSRRSTDLFVMNVSTR